MEKLEDLRRTLRTPLLQKTRSRPSLKPLLNPRRLRLPLRKKSRPPKPHQIMTSMPKIDLNSQRQRKPHQLPIFMPRQHPQKRGTTSGKPKMPIAPWIIRLVESSYKLHQLRFTLNQPRLLQPGCTRRWSLAGATEPNKLHDLTCIRAFCNTQQFSCINMKAQNKS